MSYVYVTLLFPDKHGKCSFLDGCVLTALGLRKQNVKYKIICMITKDVDYKTINILKIVYDEIIVVPYISPLDNADIKIISDIFSPVDYTDKNNYTEMCKVFTKLSIFNTNLFPYDKLCFVDCDLIPIKKFDKLFELDTPAGWLEIIKEIEEGKTDLYSRKWGVWIDIKNNQLIPKEYTDVYKPPGSSINAGLLVIKPDYELYKFFIN
jgi:lipopolysaccharide biosynthesis glycosyltransferase